MSRYPGLKRFFSIVVMLLAVLIARSQSVLLTYSTFEKTMHALEGYSVLLISDKEGVYEAMLADTDGHRYLLIIKDYNLCQPYRDGGQRLMLSDREAYAVESDAFSMLSAQLPEFMACLHITTSSDGGTEKLTALALKMPFLAQSTETASWPEPIREECRIPGKILQVVAEPASTQGFSKKIVVEIEAEPSTFHRVSDMLCDCTDRNEFFDCTDYVLFWQQGKLRDLALKARSGERLLFTYYFR